MDPTAQIQKDHRGANWAQQHTCGGVAAGPGGVEANWPPLCDGCALLAVPAALLLPLPTGFMELGLGGGSAPGLCGAGALTAAGATPTDGAPAIPGSMLLPIAADVGREDKAVAGTAAGRAGCVAATGSGGVRATGLGTG